MEVIIVTGLSGAGKSQAMHCLEDLGYYCIDNMPPALIGNFLDLCGPEIGKAAFVTDIRGGDFFDDLTDCLMMLSEMQVDCRIMFLDAADEVLIRRFSASRRSHPLAGGESLEQSIKKEREKLRRIKETATYVIDTSDMKTSRLQAEIQRLLRPADVEDQFMLTVQSFGFKNGLPLDADLVLDMRFISNPFYVKELRHLTGNDAPVRSYVMDTREAQNFADRFMEFLETTIPSYIKEGKYSLNIAFGCTGGQHRSVTMANEISERMKVKGYNVLTIHREL